LRKSGSRVRGFCSTSGAGTRTSSLLGVILAHETLHKDPAVSPIEEYIASALHAGYYGQVLLERPKLVASGTELTRRTNTLLLALLNTRDAKGRQSLTANRGNVFPGGKPLANFRSIFPANLGPATPGNPDLDAFLSAMTQTRQRNANFDQATADLLDAMLRWASPEGTYAAAGRSRRATWASARTTSAGRTVIGSSPAASSVA
jgi:hypothetical protein